MGNKMGPMTDIVDMVTMLIYIAKQKDPQWNQNDFALSPGEYKVSSLVKPKVWKGGKEIEECHCGQGWRSHG